MADRLSNGLHEKVMICYITKSRLDIQFVKKIALEMVTGQQLNEVWSKLLMVFTFNFLFIC